MSEQSFVLVGNWHYIPGPRGYTRYAYDPETAEMKLLSTEFEGYSIGQQAIDTERGIAYIVDERGDLRTDDGVKWCGGGGYLAAVQINRETGGLQLINEKRTLSTGPSYVCLDRSKRFCVVVHHVGFFYVTKILKNDNDGSFMTKTLFDDPAVVLFRVNDDGSLGEICDVSIIAAEGVSGVHTCAHLHSVITNSTCEIFFVCDKGLDKIYTYRIDREKGKLFQMDEVEVPAGYGPRYGVCHPSLPIFYSNNEKSSDIFAFQYSAISGKMTLLFTTPMGRVPDGQGETGKKSEPADIVISATGQVLYVSDRGNNTISVFAVDQNGGLYLRQTIACAGKNPRGLCLSPDQRFLLVANSDTPCIAIFRVHRDGLLQFHRNDISAICPANIRFVSESL